MTQTKHGDKEMEEDLDQDCSIDLGDFAVMAQYWMQCNDPNTANCN